MLDAKRHPLGVDADRGKIQVQLPVGRQNLVPHHSIVKELEYRFPETHFRITRIEALTHERFDPSFADTEAKTANSVVRSSRFSRPTLLSGAAGSAGLGHQSRRHSRAILISDRFVFCKLSSSFLNSWPQQPLLRFPRHDFSWAGRTY